MLYKDLLIVASKKYFKVYVGFESHIFDQIYSIFVSNVLNLTVKYDLIIFIELKFKKTMCVYNIDWLKKLNKVKIKTKYFINLWEVFKKIVFKKIVFKKKIITKSNTGFKNKHDLSPKYIVTNVIVKNNLKLFFFKKIP